MVSHDRQPREYHGDGAVVFLCRNLIEKALLRSGQQNTFAEVVEGVSSGHMQIWPWKRSCIVTQLCVYPKHKAIRVFLAAGKSEDIVELIPTVSEWARQQGCTVAEFEGRIGWERLLSRHGWKKRCVTMHLDLGDANGV